MDIINQAMLYLLSALDQLLGSYGLAIIALTAGIRLILWPLNTSQTRSMKKMQELQPKLKELQARYKDSPQKLQEAMMKFYAENKFNPFAGCLPMLVQIPIFIGLYGALNSPDFLAVAGGESFLFVNKLYNTLQSHAGRPLDNKFSIKDNDGFSTAKRATIVFNSGKSREFVINDPNNALIVTPKPLIPGEPMNLTLNLPSLGLSDEYVALVKSFQVAVVNKQTRELENATFTPNQHGRLVSRIDTVPGTNTLHMDVLVLILIYGALTLLYQRLMQAKNPTPATGADASQAKMMQLMPLVFIGMLFFIPIPAGVLIYLVVTMLFMFGQTWWVMRTEDKNKLPGGRPSAQIIDIKAE